LVVLKNLLFDKEGEFEKSEYYVNEEDIKEAKGLQGAAIVNELPKEEEISEAKTYKINPEDD